MKSICIFGAGTYGSYLANALALKFPECRIRLFDIGNTNIQSEKEIGFVSSNRGAVYKGASDGRFFGLGGTSAKWGGQLLFFSENDFGPSPEMADMVDCNVRYKDVVLGRFFKDPPPVIERPLANSSLFVKEGIWLKFSKRNLFYALGIKQKRNVEVIPNIRLLKFSVREGRIESAVVQDADRNRKEIQADRYYLTCGAFESAAILHRSGIINLEKDSRGFADHISVRCFKVEKVPPVIANTDLQFRFHRGSMITSRFVGEIDGVSFYCHPIYNEQFTLFQFLKHLIFKNRFSGQELIRALRQAPHFFPFVISYFLKRRLYIFGSWYLNIDIELDENENFVQSSSQVDDFDQNGIAISFSIPERTRQKLLRAKSIVAQLLAKENIPFTDVNADASGMKLEDTYHPYHLFFGDDRFKQAEDACHPASNLFMFNTGILKRAGGINPTAAVFCLIEKHVASDF
jgi:hypothetical protein